MAYGLNDSSFEEDRYSHLIGCLVEIKRIAETEDSLRVMKARIQDQIDYCVLKIREMHNSEGYGPSKGYLDFRL